MTIKKAAAATSYAATRLRLASGSGTQALSTWWAGRDPGRAARKVLSTSDETMRACYQRALLKSLQEVYMDNAATDRYRYLERFRLLMDREIRNGAFLKQLHNLTVGLPCGGVGERLSKVPKQALPTAWGYTIPWYLRQTMLDLGVPLANFNYNCTGRAMAIISSIYGTNKPWYEHIFGGELPIEPRQISITDYTENDSGALIGLDAMTAPDRSFVWIPADHNLSQPGILKFLAASFVHPDRVILSLTRRPLPEMYRFGTVLLDAFGNPRAAVEKSPEPVGNIVNAFDMIFPPYFHRDFFDHFMNIWTAEGTVMDNARQGFVRYFFNMLFQYTLSMNQPVVPVYFDPLEWEDVGQPSQWLRMIMEELYYKVAFIPHPRLHEIMPGIFVYQMGDRRNSAFEKTVKKLVEEGRIKGPVTISDNVDLGKVQHLSSSVIIGRVVLTGSIKNSYIFQPNNCPATEIAGNNLWAFIIPGTEKVVGNICNGVFEGSIPVTNKQDYKPPKGADDIARIEKAPEKGKVKAIDADNLFEAALSGVLVLDLQAAPQERAGQKASFFSNDVEANVSVNGAALKGLRPGFKHVEMLDLNTDLPAQLNSLFVTTSKPAGRVPGKEKTELSSDKLSLSSGTTVDNTVMAAVQVANVKDLTPKEAEKIRELKILLGSFTSNFTILTYHLEDNNGPHIKQIDPEGPEFDPDFIFCGEKASLTRIPRGGDPVTKETEAIRALVNWLLP